MLTNVARVYLRILALGVVAAACADTSRSVGHSERVEASSVVYPVGCDYTALRRHARVYLSTNDPILDILRDMQAAARDGNLALVTELGLNALRRLAEARNAGIANAASDGAQTALGTLACMAVARGVRGAAERAAEWLAPRPLFAATVLAIGGTGGLPSGFSPFGAVDVVAAQIALTIDPIPPGNASTPVTVTVHATSAKGHPVDNVLISLSVFGNNGLGSDGTPEVVDVRQSTANGGVATFVVDIDKAGGYRIRADGFLNRNEVLPTLSAVSNLFNLQGK